MDWLADFLDWHRSRFDPFDWPAADGDEYVEFMIDWQEAFASGGVGEDEARRASRRLALSPPKYRREHIPALMQVVAAMRADRLPQTGGVDPDSFEAAKLASRDCGYCSGQGLATAYEMEPAPGLPEAVGCHCVCPAGRWMRRAIGGKDAVLLRRIPDFDQVLDGRTRWSAVPLLDADPDLTGCADPAAMFAAMKRKLAAAAALPRTAPPAPDRRPGWPAAAARWPEGDPVLDGERKAVPRPAAPEPELDPERSPAR